MGKDPLPNHSEISIKIFFVDSEIILDRFTRKDFARLKLKVLNFGH